MFEQAKNGSGFVDYSSFKKIMVEVLGEKLMMVK
jgi:hypothetical protein